MGKVKQLNKLLKNVALNRSAMRINIVSNAVDSGSFLTKVRKFKAWDIKGKFLGSLTAGFTKERVKIQDLSVMDKHQGKGVASQLMNRLGAFTKKSGRRFIWTESNILDPRVITIRSKFPTKNIASGLGRYGEDSKLVDNKTAKKIISSQKAFIKSVSDVKNVRFIRRNGRIIPIRIKK